MSAIQRLLTGFFPIVSEKAFYEMDPDKEVGRKLDILVYPLICLMLYTMVYHTKWQRYVQVYMK